VTLKNPYAQFAKLPRLDVPVGQTISSGGWNPNVVVPCDHKSVVENPVPTTRLKPAKVSCPLAGDG
jgi:hypothetical protein